MTGPSYPTYGNNVGQNIPHIVALLPVGVVAEPASHEDRPDAVLEGEPVGELAVHERARRQQRAELHRRQIVLVGAARAPIGRTAPAGPRRPARRRATPPPASTDGRARIFGSRGHVAYTTTVQSSATRGAEADARPGLVERREARQCARPRRRGRRRRSGIATSAVRRGIVASASGTSAAFPSEDDRRQRHERGNEEDEPALVADVVQEQLERRRVQSRARGAVRRAAAARHRPSAAEQPEDADHHHEPHAREDVVDDREPRHAVRAAIAGRSWASGSPTSASCRSGSRSSWGRRTPRARRGRRRRGRRASRSGRPAAGRGRRRAVGRSRTSTASTPSAATKNTAAALVKYASSAHAAASSAPERLRLGADVAVPRRHHERDHRGLHQRGAVPHHVDVVGREQRAGDQAGLAAGDPPHAEREEQDRREPGQFRDQARLPHADAEERERRRTRAR